MPHEVDRIIAEAQGKLRSYEKPKPIGDVGYKGHAAILRVPYEGAVKRAVTLRRKRIADTRAEALELAYDHLIRRATDGEWVRTGEVFLDREAKKIRALCVSEDKTALAALSGEPDSGTGSA